MDQSSLQFHTSHNKVWQETDQVCNVMIMTWYWDLHEHDPPPVSDSPALLPWPDKYHHRYPPGLPRSLLTSCRSVFWSCDLCGPSWRGPRTEPGAWWGRGAGPGWRMASQAAGWRARHRRNPRWWSPAQLQPGPGLKTGRVCIFGQLFFVVSHRFLSAPSLLPNWLKSVSAGDEKCFSRS